MKSDYNEKRGKFAEMLKSKPVAVPVQEVRPVEVKPEKEPEAHVNFWIPEPLMERIKLHAVKSKKSIKQIGIEAFEAYLNTNI